MALKAALIVLAGSLALARPAWAEDGDELLRLSGRTFSIERIGPLTSLRCAAADSSDDCLRLEELDPRPQVNWEKLSDTARRKPAGKKKTQALALETIVDQHGGPWIFSVQAGSTSVMPDFPGYRLRFANGKISFVEVLRNGPQWEEASRELGLDPRTGKKAKRGFGGLFK